MQENVEEEKLMKSLAVFQMKENFFYSPYFLVKELTEEGIERKISKSNGS